jgi:hypothetical protein
MQPQVPSSLRLQVWVLFRRATSTIHATHCGERLVEGTAWILCKMEFSLVEDCINFTNQCTALLQPQSVLSRTRVSDYDLLRLSLTPALRSLQALGLDLFSASYHAACPSPNPSWSTTAFKARIFPCSVGRHALRCKPDACCNEVAQCHHRRHLTSCSPNDDDGVYHDAMLCSAICRLVA